jgi:hypothetical protein
VVKAAKLRLLGCHKRNQINERSTNKKATAVLRI